MSKKKERIQSLINIHATLSGQKSLPERTIKRLAEEVEKLLKSDNITRAN